MYALIMLSRVSGQKRVTTQQKFVCVTKTLAATFEHTLLIFDHFGYLHISLSSYIT